MKCARFHPPEARGCLFLLEKVGVANRGLWPTQWGSAPLENRHDFYDDRYAPNNGRKDRKFRKPTGKNFNLNIHALATSFVHQSILEAGFQKIFTPTSAHKNNAGNAHFYQQIQKTHRLEISNKNHQTWALEMRKAE